MQRIVSDLIKAQTDLHLKEREKQRLVTALMNSETSMRSQARGAKTGAHMANVEDTMGGADAGIRLRKDVERLRYELAAVNDQIRTHIIYIYRGA